jgi:cellobiose phosphorylase
VDEKFDPPESLTINKKTVLPIIQKYLQIGEVQGAFEQLRTYWAGLFDKLNVNTQTDT